MFRMAALGRRCAWISGLPRNPLGQLIENHLLLSKVETGGIVWSEEGRVGTYYLEFASPPRTTQVYYDRADSCAARLRPALNLHREPIAARGAHDRFPARAALAALAVDRRRCDH